MILFNSIKELKNKFSEVFIFGSGPTSFKYEDVSKIHEPIFFINDTHKFSSMCPSKNQYFFTHHITKYPDVKPITIFIKKMYYDVGDYKGVLTATGMPMGQFITTDCQASEDTANINFFQEHNWLYDKDEVVSRNRILAFFGSVTTTLYMAWFVGANKITMIGCDPRTINDDHDVRLGGKMLFQPEKIRKSVNVLSNILHLNIIHK
jgi:hypothetical protein